VNMNPVKLHQSLKPEHWLRVLKDGKDIGYSYVTEDLAAGIPRPLTAPEIKAGNGDRDLIQRGDGILIGIRSRSITEGLRADRTRGLVQVDSASWMFVTADRKHEDWTRVSVIDDGARDKKGKPNKNHLEEFG